MVTNLAIITGFVFILSLTFVCLSSLICAGIEGAAANAQVKQLEQQNSRLKEAIMRLEIC